MRHCAHTSPTVSPHHKLMCGRSIQKSDGSREETILEPIVTCPQTFVSFFPMGEGGRRMSGLRGVLNYAGCFAEGRVNRVNRWDVGLHDGLGYIHDLL